MESRTNVNPMKKSTNRPFAVLGRNIARLRDAKGIKQDAFSAITGVAISSLKDIERGVSEGRIDNRRAIAKALKCTLADLYRDEGPLPEDLNSVAETLKQLASVSETRRAVALYLLFQDDKFLEILEPKLGRSFEALSKVL